MVLAESQKNSILNLPVIDRSVSELNETILYPVELLLGLLLNRLD
jgi:hypothetical protein